MFTLVISPEENDRTLGLGICKEMWELMVDAEVAARTDPFVASLLDLWSWRENQWVKEQSLGMAEFEFRLAPPEVKAAITDRLR